MVMIKMIGVIAQNKLAIKQSRSSQIWQDQMEMFKFIIKNKWWLMVISLRWKTFQML